MIETKNGMKTADDAEQNFENIKEALKGLYEILNICIAGEEFYYDAGKDNINALYKNLIELLLNDYGLRQLLKKINNSEIDLDIVLDEYLANQV